ncbi:MAG: Coenzyme F420 hydrogenase/dehydrogenase, beta subunit C-terminal domain [Phycisphaerae bacterium]|nr:Coenzyme F420 hydrogenase/dehydrogenase, beta subunit C-terminal domain [Phycisphaerae bacterium]
MVSSDAEIMPGELYAGYACDAEVRSAASSGGVVSAILLHLLAKNAIQGALVSRIAFADGSVRGVTELACDRQEVLSHAGSAYVDTPVLRRLCACKEFNGKVAVVALPCQVRSLRKLLARDEPLREKVAMVIGLFCRGAVTHRFYQDLLRRYRVDPNAVRSVKVGRGHYRGIVRVSLGDGQDRVLSFSRVNAYRIAGMHAKQLCMSCTEHLSEQADVSVGDIFTKEYKAEPIKHSAFVCRTQQAADLLQEMRQQGKLELRYFGMQRYRKTFKRLERYGSNLAPRRFAAMLTGVGPPGPMTWRFNPFHGLAWTIFCANSRLTRSDAGRRFAYRLPAPFVSLEALLIKALSKT